MRIECPADGDDEEFGYDQPDPPGQEKKGQRFTAILYSVQAGGDACQQHEYRCAEMSDPAGEEQGDAGLMKVGGIEQVSAAVEIIPGVIERHDDHDDTSQEIDGFYAGGTHYRSCAGRVGQ